MNFEKWDDLFSFNRKLMEDDYNDGQNLVVKDKRKAGPHELATSLKLGEAENGSQKLALEEKLKYSFTDMEGLNGEIKLKNSGAISSEARMDFVRRFNGLENTNLYIQNDIKNGAFAPANVGFETNSETIRSKVTLSSERANP
jgi:hypothetical protein